MAEVRSYTTGQPCWADVTSPDVDAAARFYSDVFGWEAEPDARPEAGGYTMFSRNGKNVAAGSPPQQEGAARIREDTKKHYARYARLGERLLRNWAQFLRLYEADKSA